MNVLVACEFSGVVREAFRKRGHNAWSCDLLPAEDGSSFHYQCPVQFVMYATIDIEPWDLMIAHPPCQFMANSGVRWLTTQSGRWDDLRWATKFFLDLWNAPIPRIAIENPVMHKYAKEQIGVRQSQTIQPWQFGHPESKKTCLWLKGLPLLQPTHVMSLPESGHWRNQTPSGQNKLGPSPTRSADRSRTYQGIADAMAEQWGMLP